MAIWKSIAAVTFLALPCSAQHFLEAQASLVSVAPETRRLVAGGSLAGTSLGIAYRGRLQISGVEHRIHLDLLGLRAKEETGMEGAAPKHVEFGWDLISTYGKWSFFGGLQGIRWKQTVDAQTSTQFRDLSQTGTTNYFNSPKGTKVGARLGLEYSVRTDLSVAASYTQTEFNKMHNPGWWSLGVVYKGMKL